MTSIPTIPFQLVFIPPGSSLPPPPGARHAAAREIGAPIIAIPVGPVPGQAAWRFRPANQEGLYAIEAELLGGNPGFTLPEGVQPDARVIFGEDKQPWRVQVEEPFEGGFLVTIQAITPGVGAQAYVSVEGSDLALKYVPVIPDQQIPKWLLLPTHL